MHSRRFLMFAPALMLLAVPSQTSAAKAKDDAELMEIYRADQKDRESPLASADWSAVGPRDDARRKRVQQLIEQGRVRTGKDFERAALVFQHGSTSEDILLSHVLAVTALGKGNADARWLAAASLDRYLHRLERPQIFGTQLTTKDMSRQEDWTMEPYNRQLLDPHILEANCVPDRESQEKGLSAIRRGQEPPPPKKTSCTEPSRRR